MTNHHRFTFLFLALLLLPLACESEEDASGSNLRSSYQAGQCGEAGDKFCPYDLGLSPITIDKCQDAKNNSKCGGLYIDYLQCLGEHTTCVDGKAWLPTDPGNWPCEKALSNHLDCRHPISW